MSKPVLKKNAEKGSKANTGNDKSKVKDGDLNSGGDILKPAALTSLNNSYSLDLLEELDYKYLVLQLLSNKNQENSLMCELRFALFVSAATHPNREQCLMPFPACFFDQSEKRKLFESLATHIEAIPKLPEIQEETQLPQLTWKLLHWVFTNPLTLKPILNNVAENVAEAEKATKLKLPIPDNELIFMFSIDQTQVRENFLAAKKRYGKSFYAFHGSPTKNFHSIMHRGLKSSLNVRAGYGHGTYLGAQMETSLAYCCQDNSSPLLRKTLGGGALRCVAVCEVIDHPKLVKQQGFYVCDNDDCLQLSYLLVFACLN